MTIQELESLFVRKLESSGLSSVEAKQLKFEVVQDPKKLKILPAHAGFKIPYFNEQGKPIAHFRFRFLVDTRTSFEKLAKAKVRRYTQPENSGLQVYLPPIGIESTWAEVMQDVSQPIIITEGELKAACACKHGLVTIGLGGVWSFITDDVMLPFFTDTNWEGRKIYIVYDSDAATNVNVIRAEARLAKELGALGAHPHILRLPAKGEKVGLDDYLVAQGPEKFEDLIKAAEPYYEIEALHKMNEELLVIFNPSMIAQRKKHYLMSKRMLVDINYADRMHTVATYNKDGSIKKTKVKSAEAWLEWPGRAVCAGVTFKPGEAEFADGCLNEWKGWGVQPAIGDLKPWNDLLDYAFQHEPQHRKWFEKWAAYPLQYPGEKMSTAVVMYGVQEGTGKTFIGLSLKAIYGEHGVLIGNDELHDSRNEWAKGMQFVLGDEVTGGEKRGVMDKIRAMITRKEIRLNPKYVPSYSLPDCINYYFTSNRPDAFHMSATDRRMFVHEMNDAPLEDKFYKDYEDWLYRRNGAAALFAHLLKLPLDGFNGQAAAPTTAAKEEMKDYSLSDVAGWVRGLLREPNEILGDKKLDFYSAQELTMMYDPESKKRITPNGMGRILKELGAYQPNRGEPIAMGPSSRRVYVVRNREKWQHQPQVAFREEYDNYMKAKREKRKF